MMHRLTVFAVLLLAFAAIGAGAAAAKPKSKPPLVPKAGEYTGTETVAGEEAQITGEVLKSGGKYSVYLHAEAPAHCAGGNVLPLTLNAGAQIKEGKFKAVATIPSTGMEVTVKLTGRLTSPTELIGTASSSSKAEPAQPTISECSTGAVKFTLKKG